MCLSCLFAAAEHAPTRAAFARLSQVLRLLFDLDDLPSEEQEMAEFEAQYAASVR